MKLYEVIDDVEDEKLHMVIEYCPYGEILKFNEQTMKFSPNVALLMPQKFINPEMSSHVSNINHAIYTGAVNLN